MEIKINPGLKILEKVLRGKKEVTNSSNLQCTFKKAGLITSHPCLKSFHDFQQLLELSPMFLNELP